MNVIFVEDIVPKKKLEEMFVLSLLTKKQKWRGKENKEEREEENTEENKEEE